MAQETPGQTPEGRLIEDAARASGRSIRALAANAGMSDTRWRQVLRGWQQATNGRTIKAKASPVLLARMAIAVALAPEQLEEVGRSDAAAEQRRILAAMEHDSVAPLGPTKFDPDADEIELINASTSMTTRQKLQTIRTVLRLRAQLEAEEAAAAQKEAPAVDAEASVEQGP